MRFSRWLSMFREADNLPRNALTKKKRSPRNVNRSYRSVKWKRIDFFTIISEASSQISTINKRTLRYLSRYLYRLSQPSDEKWYIPAFCSDTSGFILFGASQHVQQKSWTSSRRGSPGRGHGSACARIPMKLDEISFFYVGTPKKGSLWFPPKKPWDILTTKTDL